MINTSFPYLFHRYNLTKYPEHKSPTIQLIINQKGIPSSIPSRTKETVRANRIAIAIHKIPANTKLLDLFTQIVNSILLDTFRVNCCLSIISISCKLSV